MNKQDGEGSILTRVAAKLEADRAALALEEEQKALKKREHEAAILRDAKIRFDQQARVERALAHMNGTLKTDVYGNPIEGPGEPDHPSLIMNHNLGKGEVDRKPTKANSLPFFGFPITSLTGGRAVVREVHEVDPRHAQLQENKHK